MLNTEKQKIEVSPLEIVFFYNNMTSTMKRMVADRLNENGLSAKRENIYRELQTLKKEYDAEIITQARRILKEFKGLEFNNQ
ncbi:hypothetical protein J5U18_12645 [Sphingobacteriaceae bacterium WQ 2009]|uniref:Uncharacterized protein n=1 Tax=Rhinopithecimicrobium faecis TaxID=2820698 RepID=A0A8T4HBR5_9SPHI|nr:hypothetical protein [Sphingobacteriaceae bacterium WQ 2009]